MQKPECSLVDGLQSKLFTLPSKAFACFTQEARSSYLLQIPYIYHTLESRGNLMRKARTQASNSRKEKK